MNDKREKLGMNGTDDLSIPHEEISVSTIPPASREEVQKLHSDVRIRVQRAAPEAVKLTDETRTQVVQIAHNLRQPLSALISGLEYLMDCFKDMSTQDSFAIDSLKKSFDILQAVALDLEDQLRWMKNADEDESMDRILEFSARFAPSPIIIQTHLDLLAGRVPEWDTEMTDTYEDCCRALELIPPYFDDIVSLCQTGRIESERHLFDVGDMVQRIVQLARNDVALGSFPDEPLLVHGDIHQLEQVVSNLVTNAVQYGTRATITVRRQDDMVHISVTDEGPGVYDTDDVLFGLFQRGKAAEKRKGYGVGLSFCKRVVEAHNGRIGACNILPSGSVEVQGACFTVELPLYKHEL